MIAIVIVITVFPPTARYYNYFYVIIVLFVPLSPTGPHTVIVQGP